MEPMIEKISAVTLRVANMMESVRFYRDVLGMELLYGGEDASFSSLRPKDLQSAILNLEQGKPVTRWGRLIFCVADVDGLWTHLKERGFDPEILFLARRLGLRTVEVPVIWAHSEGTRLHPFRDGIRMFADVIRIRWNALTGVYANRPVTSPGRL